MSIPDIFLKVIDVFRKKYPGVDVFYVAKPFTDYVHDMEDGAIDIILAHDIELSKYRNLEHQFVTEAKRGLYYGVRHPLANKKDLQVSDFAGEIHWASKYADTPEQRASLKQISDYYGMPEFSTRYLNTTNEIIFHLLLGDGFCIMDDIVLQSKPDDVLILPIEAELEPIQKSIYWDKDNINPCIPLFCEVMESCKL
jgi:DNA-binding transcriptional LysR family regulator